MHTQELNRSWKLHEEPLYYGKENYAEVMKQQDGWLPVGSLPCDVHVPLMEHGLIEDPMVADNCFKCEWIEERSWWFQKVFLADGALLQTHNSELVIEGLDVKADLFLNGTWLGHHISALYPFRKDVRDLLINGENLLAVRVTSGLEYYGEQDIAKLKEYVSCEYKGGRGPRGDNRRAMVRKPQYIYGWDWTPRLATCGIMGDARIEAFTEIAVRNLHFTTSGISCESVEALSGNSTDKSDENLSKNPVDKISNDNIAGGKTADAKTADVKIADGKFGSGKIADDKTTDDKIVVDIIACDSVNNLLRDHADISIEVEIENFYPIRTMDVEVELDLYFEDELVQSVEKEIFATSGLNFVRFDLKVDRPNLWWPNGMGPQNLYRVKVSATTVGKNILPDNATAINTASHPTLDKIKPVPAPLKNTDSKEMLAGIRTLRLNTDKIDENSRMFVFEINGIRTFCKGGNWETPDSLYGRITDKTYDILVQEAKEANFNMFRVNGCNAYERDHFYECCDRAGILIWQDFMGFSDAAYPDELDWFKAEVTKEVDYQTKRLRSHPCLALWCGNNECAGHLATYRKGGYWCGDKKSASPGGTVIYNEIMPRIVQQNSPEIPYWNSSPYGGETDMDCNEYGDRHHWIFMSRDMEERITPEEYDKVDSKFVSEFGCIGPAKKSSLIKYYGSENVVMGSDIWKMHTNTFEKNTIRAALAKHYGLADSEEMALADYLLYAGMFQGVMLGYALESLRIAKNNYGGLIWSFNDAYGEIGWSILDYYLTRKISYHFVKRALAHQKLILRERGEGSKESGGGSRVIQVICVNDTNASLEFKLEYGYVSFDGKKKDSSKEKVAVPPFTKAAVIAKFDRGEHDPMKGLFYAKSTDKDNGILPAILRTTDFKNLSLEESSFKIIDWKETDEQESDVDKFDKDKFNGKESYGRGDSKENTSQEPVRMESVYKKSDYKVTFTVTSDKYAHGVHFGLPDDVLLSDEYFDLLPGEKREITITDGWTKQSITKVQDIWEEKMIEVKSV